MKTLFSSALIDPHTVAGETLAPHHLAVQTEVGEVVTGQRVPPNAMRLIPIESRNGRTTLEVDGDRDGLTVVWPDASSREAEMVNNEVFGNRSVGKSIRVAMGEDKMNTIPEMPVPILVERGRPQPTRPEFRTMLGDWPILVHLGPKAILRGGSSVLRLSGSVYRHLKSGASAASSVNPTIREHGDLCIITRKRVAFFAIGLQVIGKRVISQFCKLLNQSRFSMAQCCAISQ